MVWYGISWWRDGFSLLEEEEGEGAVGFLDRIDDRDGRRKGGGNIPRRHWR